MKRFFIALLLAFSLNAQTKPNLVDIKPPAVPPPSTTYAVILAPGFTMMVVDPALIDRTTTPYWTLRAPSTPAGGGQLWDDVLDFSGSQTFSTLSAPLGRVYVFKNGVSMTVNRDYTQTVASGLVSVTFLPGQQINAGDSVKLLYMK